MRIRPSRLGSRPGHRFNRPRCRFLREPMVLCASGPLGARHGRAASPLPEEGVQGGVCRPWRLSRAIVLHGSRSFVAWGTAATGAWRCAPRTFRSPHQWTAAGFACPDGMANTDRGRRQVRRGTGGEGSAGTRRLSLRPASARKPWPDVAANVWTRMLPGFSTPPDEASHGQWLRPPGGAAGAGPLSARGGR